MAAQHPVATVPLETDSACDSGSAIERLPALDGIRGIAILLVLLMHYGFYGSFYSPAPSAGTLWMARFFIIGWSGVDLFFVLSGFLITSILLATRSQPQYFQKFYGRRAVRIFPLYYSALVVGLFVAPALAGDHWARFAGDTRAHQLWLWAYALNIGVTFGVLRDTGMFGPLWSLAIEEQYYLFWPYVVRYTSRAALARLCAGLIVGSLAVRLAMFAVGFGWTGPYYFTLARLDALAVGGSLALMVQEPAWRDRLFALAPRGLALGGVAIAVMFVRFPLMSPSEWFIVTFGTSILALTFGCLVAIACRRSAPAWMSAPWLRALGRYSYGIYVWHWFVRRMLEVEYARHPAPTAASGVLAAIAFLVGGSLLSIACGRVSYAVIEAPFLKLKRLFRYEARATDRTTRVDSPSAGMRPASPAVAIES